jgi:hypothetical protein
MTSPDWQRLLGSDTIHAVIVPNAFHTPRRDDVREFAGPAGAADLFTSAAGSGRHPITASSRLESDCI